MPVTHGVRGSSPLRTAKKDNRKVILFFVFAVERYAGMLISSTACAMVRGTVSKLPTSPHVPHRKRYTHATLARSLIDVRMALLTKYGVEPIGW